MHFCTRNELQADLGRLQRYHADDGTLRRFRDRKHVTLDVAAFAPVVVVVVALIQRAGLVVAQEQLVQHDLIAVLACFVDRALTE